MTTFGQTDTEFSLHGRGRIGGWRLADFHPQEEGTLTHIRGGKVEIKGRGGKKLRSWQTSRPDAILSRLSRK